MLLLLVARMLFIGPKRLHWAEVIFARLVLSAFGQKLEIGPSDYGQNSSERPRIYVMVPHTSFLDAFAIAASLPEYATGVGARNYFWWPVIGWLMCLRLKPIDRGKHLEAVRSLNTVAEDSFRRRLALVIAPEGTRAHGPDLLKFKEGAFCVAWAHNAEIVPMLITGAQNSWPRGKLLPRRGLVKVRFLPAVTKDGFQNVKEMTAGLHDQIEFVLSVIRA